jgi:putative tricarboxylic transport membrane protein
VHLFAESIPIALDLLASPGFWTALFLAILIAGPIGLIPGVGGTTTIALVLPFLILSVDPTTGLIFIGAMIALGQSLDIIPAVLLGYPGPTSTVDFLEGHQLARKGYGARVIGATYVVSAIGGVIGAVTLVLAMPFIRPLIVRFSYAEIAAMAILGVAMVVMVVRGSVLRGIAAALLGVLMATIGTAALTAIDRFNFNQAYLIDGLPLIPTVLGKFALPEIIDLAASKRPIAETGEVSNREIWIGMKEGLKRWRTIPRQSLFGVFLGAIPGVGGAVVEWLSYALGILWAKDKTQFGKGSLDGVLFTESAQAAKEAGQAIPTLAFGIPGGVGWALMLVALISYGVAPGMNMLTRDLDVTIGLVLAIGIGNVLSMFVALAIGAQVARLTQIPYTFVAGMMLPIMFLGAFQATLHIGDIMVVLSVGALGLAMKWNGWPRAPFLLGFILGPVIERNLFTSISIGGFSYILSRPYAMSILAIAIVFASYLWWVMGKATKQMAEATALMTGDVTSAPLATADQGQAIAEATNPATRRGVAVWQRIARHWQWEYATILVLGTWAGFVVLRESLSFTDEKAQLVPMWLSIAFLLVLLAIVVDSIRKRGKEAEHIFDIGMRTGTDASAVKALLPIFGWIAGFILLGGSIGFKYAAVIFPLLFINANLDWRGKRRLWSLIPAGFAAFVSFVMLDGFLHVIWPERFVLKWFGLD